VTSRLSGCSDASDWFRTALSNAIVFAELQFLGLFNRDVVLRFYVCSVVKDSMEYRLAIVTS
jgi:hypothetical protein